MNTITHVLIAGSRDANREMLDYARRAVRRAQQQGYTVIVGDNPKGVDLAVVRECRRLRAKVIVAGESLAAQRRLQTRQLCAHHQRYLSGRQRIPAQPLRGAGPLDGGYRPDRPVHLER